MKRLLVLFPTVWDRRHLGRGLPGRPALEIHTEGPEDHDCVWDYPIFPFLEDLQTTWPGRADGVLSTSDYPGAALAALLATRLGLPGAPPRAILVAGHKHASRVVTRVVAPEATPWFRLVGPGEIPPDLPFPCFVKPLKGSFSMLARRVTDPAALEAHLASPAAGEYLNRYVMLFESLRRRVAPDLVTARGFLAEECLGGSLVTVEGWITDDEVGFLGIVDSGVDPATRSFVRFEYPSALDAGVQDRLRDIASRVVRAHGLRWTTWNVEMFHDAAHDRISVVELNPRLAGQFADLYEKVDGVNGYEAAVALALGETPPRGRGGRFRAASSTPLRIFRPSRVRRAPDAERIAAVEREHPGTLVWVECATGDKISDFATLEDGASARIAVVNQGGDSREELVARMERIRQDLDFDLEPLR